MCKLLGAVAFVGALSLGGCASIDFNAPAGKGLQYYETTPFLIVQSGQDCVTTASVVMIPTQKKYVAMNSGYGSSELSVAISPTNGMITNVGQTTDADVAGTITSLATLATATKASSTFVEGAKGCSPKAKLFKIEGADTAALIQSIGTFTPELIQ